MSSPVIQNGNISPEVRKGLDKEPRSFESGYQSYSSYSSSSFEQSFDSVDEVDGPECPGDVCIPFDTNEPHSIMFGEDGIPFNHGQSFWGANIRTYELLDKEMNFQSRDSYLHVLTFVVPEGRMDQLHARKEYLLVEINGAPTHTMTGECLAKHLRELEGRILKRWGGPTQIKFLQIEGSDAIYHNVLFMSMTFGGIEVTNYTSEKAKKSDIGRDDDSDIFVRDLDFMHSKKFIFLRPAPSPNQSTYYIYSDGNKVQARDYYDSKEKGYIFQIEQYYGKYEGNPINSLTGGSFVHPMVMVLPDDVSTTKKIVCARSHHASVDVVDYNAAGLKSDIDKTEWVIHSPNPGIFFARPIDGSSIVFRTSTDTSYFIGIENGRLLPLQPRRDYKTDSRLHFHRIHFSATGDAVRSLRETTV